MIRKLLGLKAKDHVRFRVIQNMTLDLRHPRQVHRMKRARECRKVAPAMEWRP